MRAEQDLRNQLKIEIDPDQPINFESYGHNRAGFWNKTVNTLNDLGNSKIINKINYFGNQITMHMLGTPDAWLESAGEHLMPYQSKYLDESSKLFVKGINASNTVFNFAVNRARSFNEGWKLGNSKDLQSLPERYFKQAELYRYRSQAIGLMNGASKVIGAVEWSQASMDVTNAPRNEKIWVAARQYGGIIAGRFAAGSELVLTLPTDAFPGAVVLNIASAVVVSTTAEKFWRSTIDKLHDKFSKNTDEWYVQKFNK